MEIMGFLFFVLLIVIFFLVYISISSPSSKINEDQSQYYDLLTHMALQSILYTDTCETNVKGLIKDYVLGIDHECSYKDETLSSEEFLTSFINDSLNILLERPFYFRIQSSSKELVINNCETNERISPSSQIFSLYPYKGSVIITLSLC